MSLVESSTPKRGHNLPLVSFPQEMRMEVIMHLPPRHVYKLMQTNKEIYKLCTSDKYWGRAALHIMWKTGCPWSFLGGRFPAYPGSTIHPYKNLMDRFVCEYRLGARLYDDYMHGLGVPEMPALVNPSTASASELLEWSQKLPSHLTSSSPRFIEGETAFQVAKRGVEDTEGVPRATQNVLRMGRFPAAVGFMTARRFVRMQCGDFLHLLEDEESMSPEVKHKVAAAVDRLLGTMYTGPQAASAGDEVSCDAVRPWYYRLL